MKTVTVTGLEGHHTPSTSSATALRVCVPLLAGNVFQGTEYGEAVSAAPRLPPSSWNWTRWTVRAPTMLTVALTEIVPPTVDLDVGDVTVTTRLPRSCADAGVRATQAPPTNVSSVVRASRARDDILLRLIATSPSLRVRIGSENPNLRMR